MIALTFILQNHKKEITIYSDIEIRFSFPPFSHQLNENIYTFPFELGINIKFSSFINALDGKYYIYSYLLLYLN